MIEQKIDQLLLELAHQNSEFLRLESETLELSEKLNRIESARAYKLKLAAVRVLKQLRLYHPIARRIAHFLTKIRALKHQLITAEYYQLLLSLSKFLAQKGTTLLQLFFTKRELFQLYFTHHFANNKNNLLYIEKITQNKPKQQVDIIIPWYGDPNIVKLVGLLKLYDQSYIDRVFVINDAYPDTDKTAGLFRQLQQLHYTKLKILTNPENKGFVATVNRGMKLSNHDVVLLNSDTIPTEGWIAELRSACYASDKTATATPFSNNATIFSLQRFNQPTEDTEPGKTAKAIQALSSLATLEVPTAHGFCMYIKRSVLTEIGYFDAKRYGKGYCEENDFSMKALHAGYQNVAATKAYVLHLEGRSFGSAKRQAQIAENYTKLLQRYPEYHGLVHRFLATGRLKQYQKTISLLLPEWYKQKKYALLINHSDIFTAIGGVERTTFEEILRLAKHGCQNVLLYYFDEQLTQYRLLFIENKKVSHIIDFEKGANPLDCFEWILRAFCIELVIGNHLLRHSLSYFKILKQKNIPNLCFIHDYFYLTGSPDLLEHGEFLNPRTVRFMKSLAKNNHGSQLLAADTIVFNSELTHQVYEQCLGKMPNAIISYPDRLIGTP